MIWSLDYDLKGERSLLSAIYNLKGERSLLSAIYNTLQGKPTKP